VRAAVASSAKHPFAIASNPEFLKEGDAVNDFLKPQRVIVGADDQRAIDVLRDAYRGVMRTGDRMQVMDIRSAELTKYAANAMLATRISFMNEVANLCEKVGANVDMVRRGIGSDSRIGPSFLFPGPGYGGSCFPKDVKALVRTAAEMGMELKVLSAVEDVNQSQKLRLGEKLRDALGDDLHGTRIAVWGLAFKPQTDDMRDAPSLTLIDDLLEAGATVCAHDPASMNEARHKLGDRITYAETNYDALSGADALVVVTDWNEYRHPDFSRVKALLRRPVLIDGRNLYDPAKMADLGFTYHSIGRQNVEHPAPQRVGEYA
jgi:UDPglucose 6-dehydrogenase